MLFNTGSVLIARLSSHLIELCIFGMGPTVDILKYLGIIRDVLNVENPTESIDIVVPVHNTALQSEHLYEPSV